jgi:hypothetical protein
MGKIDKLRDILFEVWMREGVMIVLNLESCGINTGGGKEGLREIFAVDSCQTILRLC